MGMQIEKTFVIKAAPAVVWAFFTDPRRVARCLPGAAVTEQEDERTYAGTITVKVGPVSTTYRGRARFERLDVRERVAEVFASGQDLRGKGGADVRMTARLIERGPGETEVSVVSELSVTGVLAQFGRGMIQQVGDLMFQMFTDAMRTELESGAEAPAEAVGEPAAGKSKGEPTGAVRAEGGPTGNVLLATGLTGVATLFLSAVVYALQIFTDPSTATKTLTVTFLVINAVAWWVGYSVCSRRPEDALGMMLLATGDAIFPFNLFAPFFLYLFPLKGQVFRSASAVLLIGLIYHLPGYVRFERSRFPAFFYPYFFAASGGALLYLSQFTVGLSLDTVVWLILGWGVALHFVGLHGDTRLRRHFSFAVPALLLATDAATGISFYRRPTLTLLVGFFAVSGILFALAWTSRRAGPVGRLLGLASYISLTLAFTASLYYLKAPASLYVVSTTAWVLVLTLLSILLKGDAFEPFRESALWLSVALGLGLIALCVPVYAAARLEQPVTPVHPLALLTLSGAFFLGSLWRWRHPIITHSLGGFIANAALLNLTSYLAPLLVVPAASGLWIAFGGVASGIAYVPFVLGVLYLSAAEAGDPLYPMTAFRVAGALGIFSSALIALRHAGPALFVLMAGALVFLWRSARERSTWIHSCSLGMASGAGILAALEPTGRVTMVPLGILSLVLLGVYRWVRGREGWNARARLTLAWALAVVAGVVIVEATQGNPSPTVFLSLWLGLLVGLGGWGGRSGPQSQGAEEETWLRAGYWLAHGAGGACLISALRAGGLPAGYAGPALAVWAWLLFGASRVLTARASSRPATTALRQAVHGFALLSLLLAAAFSGAHWEVESLSVIACLVTGALYLVLRLTWRQPALEHAAAVALIEAVALLGLSRRISWPEFYQSLLGLYLCLVLYLRFRRKASGQAVVAAAPRSPAAFGVGLGFVKTNLLPLAILLLSMVYPLWALVRSLEEVHVFFLAGATVVLLPVFLTVRQQPIFVYAVCLLFGLGVVFRVAFGHPTQSVSLSLVLVGSLIVASLAFVGNGSRARLPGWGGKG